MKNIQFPKAIKQIPRFEKQNDTSVNVYILQKNKKGFTVLSTYLTKDKKEQDVNLLVVQNIYHGEEKDGNDDGSVDAEPVGYHYVWIKNQSRLLSS